MAIRRILVYLDLGNTSDAAVSYARELAATFEATLHFLYVIEEPFSAGGSAEVNPTTLPEVQEAMTAEAEGHLNQVLSEVDQSRFGVTLDVEMGPAAEQIELYAREDPIDLLVLGVPDGRDAAAATAMVQDIVGRLACSVFVVREPAATARPVDTLPTAS